MRRFKQTSKKNSSKVKYEIKNNNVLFEDASSPNIKIKIIVDKNKPFYEHNLGDGNGSIKF